MSVIEKIKKTIQSPLKIVVFILNKIARIFPDKQFLQWKYRLMMGQKLDLENPKTFSEKIQWLKLYDRKPEYTKMVDKIDAKEYVASIIGEEYIIPTLGVYDSFDEIDFDKLPNQFVLKCSHDSGGVVICKDKSTLDIKAAKEKLEKGLRNNYYYQTREWPYKNVQPRIIAEKFMIDESGTELKDYKFFCFHGKVKMMFVATGRPHNTCFNFYDKEFNLLPIKQYYPNASKSISRPNSYEEMIRLSELLAKDIPHVRIDFYSINERIYFGEITFYHFSGIVPFEPNEWDRKIGDLLNLNKC